MRRLVVSFAFLAALAAPAAALAHPTATGDGSLVVRSGEAPVGVPVVALTITGSVRLAGLPDTPHGDGKYSLNNGDFTSLPGVQTGKLVIGNG